MKKGANEKASTRSKKALKQSWAAQRERRDRGLRYQRESKTREHHALLQDGPRFGQSRTFEQIDESTTWVKRTMLPCAKTQPEARKAIAERIVALRSWQQQAAYLFLVLRAKGLSKDLSKYFCSWLVPKKERLVVVIEEEEDTALMGADNIDAQKKKTVTSVLERHNIASGEVVSRTPLPPGFLCLNLAWDRQDAEVWLFNDTPQATWDMQRLNVGESAIWVIDWDDNVREIRNPAILEKVKQRWTRIVKFFAGNYLFFYDQFDGLSAFQPHPKTGTLTAVVDVPKPIRSFHEEAYDMDDNNLVWTLAGDMLFVLLLHPCFYYPTELDPSVGCICCGGSNYVRVKNARNCCVALQVLFLSDLEYGWTLLAPPPVHYSVFAPLPQMWVDLTLKRLYLAGGSVDLDSKAKKVGAKSPERIEGGYVLSLAHPATKFVYDKKLQMRADVVQLDCKKGDAERLKEGMVVTYPRR